MESNFEVLKKTESRKEFERVIKMVFAEADTDSNGYLDKKEVLEIIIMLVPEQGRRNMCDKIDIIRSASEIMASMDKNKDGKVSFEEFHECFLEKSICDDREVEGKTMAFNPA